jgi:hypothetical protein
MVVLSSASMTAPARAQGATGTDSKALAAEKKAMDDYLGLHIGQAVERLQSAIKTCGDSACSARVRAHLHLSLGFVYGAGNRDLKSARDEFAKALKIDKNLPLDPDMASRDVSRAFKDAQADAGSESTAPPSSATAPAQGGALSTDSLFAPPLSAVDDRERSSTHEELRGKTAEAARTESPFAQDSVALYAEADLALLTPVSNVCSPGAPANWVCFNPDGSRYAGTPQAGFDNNNIKPGLGFSTVRIVAAYDHSFGDRWSVGLRLGFALNGGPTPPGGSAFMPVHAEARASYLFSAEPAPLVPFAFASVGVEEVDTHVSVLVAEVPCSVGFAQECNRTLNAWRRAGFTFLGGGGGARFPLGAHGAVVGDLRLGFTFSSVAFVLTPELGYAYTF